MPGYDGRSGEYGASSDDDEDGNNCLEVVEVEEICKRIVEESLVNESRRIGEIAVRVQSVERSNRLLLKEIVNLRLKNMEDRLSQLRQQIPRYEAPQKCFSM